MSVYPNPPQADADAAPAAPAEEAALVISAEMLVSAKAEPRRDFERGMSPFPRTTIALLCALVATFVWEELSGALDNVQALLAAGAINLPELQRGEVWRLVTCLFLHADANHLIGNCVALYIIGMASQQAFGAGRTLMSFFLTGAVASAVSVWFQPVPTVGASGAIFGLIGAVIAFLYRYRDKFYLRDARIAWVLLVWSLCQVGTGFLNPQVANAAHCAGLILGGVLGLLLPPKLQYGESTP
ncbi:MAG TPA: rhomboid family intramembrane serine protease [Pirellulales bacterium]|nr:rhomboid family intramembrane serine protease [Pirellulales bacterium]